MVQCYGMLTPSQIRQSYLDFFKKNGHAIVPSAPIVPENDPTTLFTGSGMQPMITYLLGEPHSLGKRIADSQKCFRSQDIEEVGDNRHTTFFEMLGNWSLGDYFKKEQLRWFFTFLTEEVGLAPEKLFVTVFSGDQNYKVAKKVIRNNDYEIVYENLVSDLESVELWKKLFEEKNIIAEVVKNPEKEGLQNPNGRIFFYPAKKNWWSRAGEPSKMPAGEPGGPDSEVFYDFGADLKLHETSKWKDEPCHVNCDCGRFLEIGNSVFMQYQKQADGSFTELPQKNVDFGGGLERIAAAQNDDRDVFMTELFQPIIKKLEAISGKSYAGSEETKHSFRVIADHMRAAVMLATDGVFPSNKEQGYFARRLVRRSIRYGRMIGITKPFLAELVPLIAQIYTDSYPAVTEKQKQVTEILSEEERKFNRTLDKGLQEFEKFTTQKQEKLVEAHDAFFFYESYGWPVEIFIEEAQRKNFALGSNKTVEDFLQDFATEKKAHAESSRTASAGKFKGGLQDQSETTVKYHTATHLLQAALRKVLGTHVQQKGSNITAERLRFDFSHPQALTEEEKTKVMELIHEWIASDLPVTRQVMAKDKALASGAIAFFAEKYPDEVSVYTIGKDPENDWISKELCGGPHVEHTGVIGKLKLQKEQPVSAGVRRIYLQLN